MMILKGESRRDQYTHTDLAPLFFVLLGTGRGHTDFNTSIAIFSKFTGKVFVQFGVKDTIGDL
jgi:hypothetical protein